MVATMNRNFSMLHTAQKHRRCEVVRAKRSKESCMDDVDGYMGRWIAQWTFDKRAWTYIHGAESRGPLIINSASTLSSKLNGEQCSTL